jgi:opacity protein-like surface antigen
MKKKMPLITFTILCLSAFSLHAGIRIGVKAGVNLANADFNAGDIKTDNFTGFQVGPVIEIGVLPVLSVDAAVLYSQQGFKIKNNDYYYEQKSSTIDIPANLKFHFPLANQFGIYLGAGPYISLKVDEQTTFGQIKNKFGSKEFGAGLNFGAGLELFKHMQIGANYQLCLTEDYSNGIAITDWAGHIIKNFKGKTRIWSITATYFF